MNNKLFHLLGWWIVFFGAFLLMRDCPACQVDGGSKDLYAFIIIAGAFALIKEYGGKIIALLVKRKGKQ